MSRSSSFAESDYEDPFDLEVVSSPDTTTASDAAPPPASDKTTVTPDQYSKLAGQLKRSWQAAGVPESIVGVSIDDRANALAKQLDALGVKDLEKLSTGSIQRYTGQDSREPAGKEVDWKTYRGAPYESYSFMSYDGKPIGYIRDPSTPSKTGVKADPYGPTGVGVLDLWDPAGKGHIKFIPTAGGPGGLIGFNPQWDTSSDLPQEAVALIGTALTLSGVGTALGAAITSSLGVAATAATNAFIGNTIMQTVVNGGDIGSALKSSIASWAGAQVGDLVGKAAESMFSNPEGLRMISDVANQATRAAILGQDVESAVKNTIVAGAVDFATAKIPGFNELPSAVKNTVKQSINAAVQGKDIDPGTMLANAAKEGVLSYGLNQIPDFKNADPRTQSFISTMLRTAIDQGDLSQAAINFAVNQAQQEFQKTIKAGPALDELKKAGLIPEANYHALDAGQKELVDSFLQQKDPKAAATKYVSDQQKAYSDPTRVIDTPTTEAAYKQIEEAFRTPPELPKEYEPYLVAAGPKTFFDPITARTVTLSPEEIPGYYRNLDPRNQASFLAQMQKDIDALKAPGQISITGAGGATATGPSAVTTSPATGTPTGPQVTTRIGPSGAPVEFVDVEAREVAKAAGLPAPTTPSAAQALLRVTGAAQSEYANIYPGAVLGSGTGGKGWFAGPGGATFASMMLNELSNPSLTSEDRAYFTSLLQDAAAKNPALLQQVPGIAYLDTKRASDISSTGGAGGGRGFVNPPVPADAIRSGTTEQAPNLAAIESLAKTDYDITGDPYASVGVEKPTDNSVFAGIELSQVFDPNTIVGKDQYGNDVSIAELITMPKVEVEKITADTDVAVAKDVSGKDITLADLGVATKPATKTTASDLGSTAQDVVSTGKQAEATSATGTNVQAVATTSELTQSDVTNIVNSAIAANPGLNVQDVQNVVNQAIAGLPAGLSMADVNTAITDALKTLPASVTPGEMQTAISTAVSDLGTSVTGQIGDLKNSVTAALDAAKSQGLQGDAALQAAIEKVAGDLGTTRESLLSQLGTTEESLRSEFASQLGTATGALAGQIGDVETRLLDKINAAQQSGLKGDAALQSAIDGVAADLGTTRDALLGQIGQTEQSLRTQFETALGGVQTQVQQQATSLANLDARIDALMQQGLDAKTATEAALNELGQTQTKTSTELNSRIDALVQQGVDTRTATQQAINELTTSQQEATSRLDARIDQLIQQGMDQQTATRTAIDELSGQVATTQTQTQTALADVNARINELMQQGVDYQTATQRALTELGGGLGELGKGFQEYVTSQEKARQEEQEAQRKAQQQARSQAGMQQALTALGAAGVAAAPAQDYYAKFKDPFMTKVTADKFVSPLESFLKEVQSPSDVGSFLKSDTTRQPDRIAQEENPMDYFNYGKVQSVDDILRLDQPDSPYGFRRGGIVPAFAGGGALNVVNFAGKPRIDFRHGSAVHGPGDGQSDDIPAMLADGEYVFDAETVSALGNGSTKAGAEALDKMRLAIRKHKRSGPLDSIPPPSKTPLEYLAMGRKKG